MIQSVEHHYANDNLGRLTFWDAPLVNKLRNYTYDIVGNRTLRFNGLGDSTKSEFTDPVGPNRLSRLVTPQGRRDYSYTPDGALRTRSLWVNGGMFVQLELNEFFSYDMHGNVSEYYRAALGNNNEFWQYRHSPAGEREQKRVYAETLPDEDGKAYLWTYYHLAGSRQLSVWNGLQTRDTNCGDGSRQVWMYPTEYLTYGAGDAHAISFKPDGSKNYKIADHLGSTRILIDENGVLQSQLEYAPFGEQVANYGVNNTAPRKGFIDKETDGESGLGDYSARKFDDELGRFTSVDALWEKYRSLSPYQYARNNPLMRIDPSGNGDIYVKAGGKDGERIKFALSELAKTAEGARLIREVKKLTNTNIFTGDLITPDEANPTDKLQGNAVPVFSRRKTNSRGKVVSIKLRKVKITIDLKVFDQMNKNESVDEKKSALVQLIGHELRHAEQAASDPVGYVNTSEEESNNNVPYRLRKKEADAFAIQNRIRIQYEAVLKKEKEAGND